MRGWAWLPALSATAAFPGGVDERRLTAGGRALRFSLMDSTRSGQSYYAATANSACRHPRLRGDRVFDVCVVGAGFTGLSAALVLAERGYRVAVLDAERVGWGASGRNGGQMLSGYAPGLAAMVKSLGVDTTRSLWRISELAKARVRERIARHDIACDERDGSLLAAVKPGHMRELEEEAELAEARFGYRQYRLIGPADIRAQVASRRFHGGLLDGGAGHFHPLNYALGLGTAAAAAGVEIFENSRVVRIETGKGAVAHTGEGRVRCRFLLLAGKAHVGAEAPGVRRMVMPVGTYIIATGRLGEERAQSLIPAGLCVSDTRFVLDYFRLSADHRLLFGGKVSYSGLDPWNIAGSIRRRMVATFPNLADAAIDFAWGGQVAITRNRLPCFGRLGNNVFYAVGFSGQGVALTTMAGEILADAVAGQAERFDVLSRIPHRAFPGGSWMRVPLLVLATLYYRLRDYL